MPGIVPLGKLFFSYFFERFLGQNPTYRKARAIVCLRVSRACHPGQLIVGRIIRPKWRRRSEYLIALDGNAAMPARNELILVRIRRNDSGTSRWQTINYPSIGRYSKHSDAH
jgi:hypothetical protein